MKVPIVLQPGIFADDTPFSGEPRWIDGNNMRPWRGSMQTIGGWSKMTDGLSGVCRAVMPWTDDAGAVTVALGTHTNLYVYAGGELSDITPTSDFSAGSENGAGGPGYGAGGYGEDGYGDPSTLSYFPLTWSFANWGEYLLACPRGQTVFVWQNDPGTEADAISNAPAAITAIVMSPERRQIIALGCSEEISEEFNPLCIRGCDFEDYTDWTTASDNNAFEHILPGSGRIVGGAAFGAYLAIWTDTALWMGTYLGLPDQTYRFDMIADGCGLIAPNAFRVVNQLAVWISPDRQIYTWTLGGLPQSAGCTVRDEFKDHLVQSQVDKIVACSVAQYGEVWFFYPDDRDGLECSRYIAVGQEGWYRGIMPRSACIDAGTAQYPIFVTPDGTVYWHENGQSADGAPLDWHLLSSDFYLDSAQNHILIRGMWPDFYDQQGAIEMTVTTRNWPQANTSYTRTKALPAGRSRRDFMASGRVAQVGFSGSSAPAFARLGKPVFDAVVTGGF